jgi:hypothetical protein
MTRDAMSTQNGQGSIENGSTVDARADNAMKMEGMSYHNLANSNTITNQ